MQQTTIDLTKPCQLHPMFGGAGACAYADLECSSTLRITSEPSIHVRWSARGVGFGEAYLSNTRADSECMSPSFIAALFNEQLKRASWSEESRRGYQEECVVLAVGLDKVGDMVAFRYRTEQGVGVIYLWNEPLGAADEEGDYSDFTAHVDVDRSVLKSQGAVLKVIQFWLEGIPAWD